MNMLLLRQWHGYLGAFIAPSVIFFALTGALQLFSLHEAHGAYRPAPTLERLSSVHQDQVFALGHHHDHGSSPSHAPAGPTANHPHAPDDDDRPTLSTLLLKWFFLGVALGLATSATVGAVIGLTRPRGKAATLVLLIAGAAIPLILLIL